MSLKITLSGADPLKLSTDLLVVGVAAGAKKTGLLKLVLKALGSTGSRAMKRAEFTGKLGQVADIPGGGAIKAGRVALVGLGAAEGLGHADVRRFAARAARFAGTARAKTMAIALGDLEACCDDAVAAAAAGAVLGGYRYEAYKTGDRKSAFPLEKAALLTNQKVSPDLRATALQGQQLGESVCIARDLINMPPNDLYPAVLANHCKDLAKRYKKEGLSCTVMSDTQLKAKGMHLLSAVGQGSVRGPRLVHMKYVPPGAAKRKEPLKRLVFVGKGLTFDTGGICIKPAPGMEEMKGDMGGAANVAALMAAVAVTQPQAEIHGIIASAENMPGGNAYRPGDIFPSYEGKTVEIINTDAEGRLALADALAYGAELEPDLMVDNATLTGACVVALGPTVSAYYSNREHLADALGAAAKTAGEAMWHMPLVEDLREMLKSDWADLKHMGDRWGGSITAALFLREFVGDTPWIHLDVAGPSMANKAYDIYTKGGTGAGVLTYLELIKALTAEPAAPADDAAS